MEEIGKACKKLKNRKSVGVDEITNEVLKCEKLHKILQTIFNYCFDKGTLPDTWCKAIVIPTLKGSGNDPYIPQNYRGISLLSCVGKLYTSILCNRINKYLDTLGVIAEEQNGICSKRSSEDHIYSLN